MEAVVVKKISWGYDKASPAGWHVMTKREDGEWESLSGPHFSYLAALIAARKITPTLS